MASRLAPWAVRSGSRMLRRSAKEQRRGFQACGVSRSASLNVHRNTDVNKPDMPFAFNDQNQQLIKEVLSRYPSQYKKAAVMPLLDLGQRQHGFTSISVMNEVARILEMPPMRVYEVATFYTMYNRTPVGRFHVQCCTTTPCQLNGSDGVMRAIEEELGIHHGETTADNMFTFTEVECLGACANAPMVQINDDYYEDLTPETTKELLRSLREAALATGASGRAPGLAGASGTHQASRPSTGRAIKLGGAGYTHLGSNVPPPGPMSRRVSCENAAGQTSLLGELPRPEDVLRKDGAL